MLKILLVYDDFQELTSIELMLKKIGFDVVGITSEFSLAEQLLSFNPQIVVAQGRTAKVSTANVGRRLRESLRWDGHSVLIFYPNAKPQPTELLKIRMDVGLEYPVEPTKMVQVLAQLGSLDANQLLDKLIKSMAQETATQANKDNQALSSRAENESVFVSGGTQASEESQKLSGSQAQEEKQSLGGSLNEEENQRLRGEDGQADQTRSQASDSTSLDHFDQNELVNSSAPLDLPEELKGKVETGLGGPLFPLHSENQTENGTNIGGVPLASETGNALNGTFDVNPFQLETLTQDPVMQELENLLQKKSDLSLNPPIQDSARQKKYEEYMKSIPIQQLSSIKRKEAKSRLRDLIKDIDKSGLEDQDVLRREYVKALFKKEG